MGDPYAGSSKYIKLLGDFNILTAANSTLQQKYDALVKEQALASTTLEVCVNDYNELCDNYEELETCWSLARAVNKSNQVKSTQVASKEVVNLRKELKRSKEQVRRLKSKTGDNGKVKIAKLTQELSELQPVLRQALIYVGTFTDSKKVNYMLYDRSIHPMMVKDGRVADTHQLFVMNQYGHGKLIYRDTITSEIHFNKVKPSEKFTVSAGLLDFCETYYECFLETQRKIKHV